MLNLVLFGPPGAGKGTQSENLIKEFGLDHISTGDVFRYNMKNDTALGKEAKSYIDRGALVPDEVTIKMLEAELEKKLDSKGVIFDGFPRTVRQATALDALMQKHGKSISGMVALKVEKEELVKRLLKRGETSGRSDDKDEQLISNRITEYENKTEPVAGYYKEQGKYKEIKGTGSIEEIFNDIKQAVNSLNK